MTTARAIGGCKSCESAPPRSTARLRFPAHHSVAHLSTSWHRWSRREMPEQKIRLLCVDDHPLVLKGLIQTIALEPDMTVIAVTSTGEDAVASYRKHRPDITLMDLHLPSMSGLEAISAIRSEDPGAQIIVLTMYHGDEDIHRAL